MSGIRSTGDEKYVIAFRIIAGLPLAAIGAQHLFGIAPLLPILQGTSIPLPEFNAYFGPAMQVIAGLLLLTGAYARIGGLLGIGAMAVGLFTHLTFSDHIPPGTTELFTWPDEPPIFLPIIVLLCCAVVVLKGAGKWSLDEKASSAA